MTLVGVPGIGKSRLVFELMRHVEADSEMVTWRQGRCLPYGDGVSFWALAEIVKAQAGILENDDDAEVRTKARACGARARRRRRGGGLGRAPPAPARRAGLPAARPAADQRDSEAFAAWRRFFEALADRRPAVIVFEDLHWADDALLDFVDSLVERIADVPLLIVATTRPELLDRRPSWGGGKANATTLSLAPLSADETLQLVRCAERRAGPPGRGGADGRASTPRATRSTPSSTCTCWEERQHAGPLPLPETVQGLIAARLDALPTRGEERAAERSGVRQGLLARSASGGRRDRRRDGGGVSPCAATKAVRAASAAIVGGGRERVRVPPRPGARRRVLARSYVRVAPTSTRRAAAWIESLGRPDDHAEMLAHHYVSALKLAGPDLELTERALCSLIRAGERASAVNAFASAAAYYERALELLPEADSRRLAVFFAHARALFSSGYERRGPVLEKALSELLAAGENERAAEVATFLAELAWIQARRSETDEHLVLATALTRDRPPSPSKARVVASVARFRMLADDQEAAIAVGREAIKMAETFGLTETRAQTLISVGTARFLTGDDGGRDDIERGIELALASNHLAAAARGYQNLSHVTNDGTRELELLSEAENLWLRLGHEEGARYPQANRAGRLFAMGRWDEALPLIDAFLADCEAGRPHYQEAMMRLCRAWARFVRDDVDGSIADLERSVAVARSAKDPQTFFAALGDAAYMYGKLGRLDEARKFAQEMVAADPQSPLYSSGFLLAADRLDLRDAVRRALDNDRQERRREMFKAAAADRRFVEAAEIATSTDDLDVATDLRVVAAEALLEEGLDHGGRRAVRTGARVLSLRQSHAQ